MQKKKSDVRRIITVLAAAVLMAVNIQTFVNPAGLYPGGVTGLAILIQAVFSKFFGMQVSYTLINVILNAIPVYIGFRYIGKKFTLYSVIMIIVSSVLVDVLPEIHLTDDVFLSGVFGGIINGAAIGMCLAVDATSGGTDFISIYLSQKSGKDSFNLILVFNIVILAAAGLMFGWDKALYSIIFQYASTQILHLVYRNYQKVTLFVVTNIPDEISRLIYSTSGHGATIVEGKGSHLGEERFIVYSVIDAPDAPNIEKEIHAADGQAFVDCIATKEIRGNFYYRKLQ